MWWTAWREGESVFVQQRIVIADESMSRARSALADALPYELVGRRRTHSEEGESVSQWLVSLADLREFIERRTRA